MITPNAHGPRGKRAPNALLVLACRANRLPHRTQPSIHSGEQLVVLIAFGLYVSVT